VKPPTFQRPRPLAPAYPFLQGWQAVLAAAALIGLHALACATVLGHATITSWVVPLALAGSGIRIIGAGVVSAQHLRT
jgi:uncharacterized membrane protein